MKTTKQLINELEKQNVDMKIEDNCFYLNGVTVSDPSMVIRSYLRDMGIQDTKKTAKEIIDYLKYRA